MFVLIPARRLGLVILHAQKVELPILHARGPGIVLLHSRRLALEIRGDFDIECQLRSSEKVDTTATVVQAEVGQGGAMRMQANVNLKLQMMLSTVYLILFLR
jgi:hypothetical protein